MSAFGYETTGENGLRLILHVGGGKCGSSAIQDVLGASWSELGTHGVLVPDSQLGVSSERRGQQIRFFQNAVRDSEGPTKVQRRLERLRHLMQNDGLHTLILSAENLINQEPYSDLFAGVENQFDLQIIAYVRRQDDYFTSAWQQWGLKLYSSVQEYLDARLGKEADWANQLLQWEQRFGRERITVRRFQRSSLIDGDVVADFCWSARLAAGSLDRAERYHNRSWNENAAELLHRVRDVFESQHDNQAFADLHYAIGEPMFKDHSGSTVLTLDERKAVMSAYEASNRMLAAKYFPEIGPGDRLFDPPEAVDVVELDELERLRRQQDVLVRGLLGLVRRVRSLEQRAE